MVFRGSGHPPPQRPGERRARHLGFEALLIAIVLFGSFTWLAPKTHAANASVPPIVAYAGSGIGDGYSNYTSRLNTPTGVAVDSSGDVFIADMSEYRVRMVAGTTCSSSCLFGIATTKNSIYTVAGNGTQTYSGDLGPASSAGLRGPMGLAVDSAGDLIITDTDLSLTSFAGNNRIRLVAATTSSAYGLGTTTIGDIYTVAGTGTAGYTNDGFAATTAEINAPAGVAVDSSGNIIFADNGNNVIRMVVQTSGTYYGVVATTNDIYTVAGNATNNGAAGYGGDIFGLATAAAVKFNGPMGIAIDSCTSYLLYNCSGNILIADGNNQRVRMVAKTTCSSNCAYGANNNITTANHIYTVVGTGTAGSTGDNGIDTSATLDYPAGLVVDSSGNLLITDSSFSGCSVNHCAQVGNDNVRLVAKAGTYYGVSATANYIYTIAGSTTESSAGDSGAATSAFLDTPTGIALDSSGDVLVADSSSNGNADRIRMISEASNCSSSCVYGLSATTTNDIYTIAGNGTEANSTSVTPATAADVQAEGVAVDSAGNVLIANTFNNRVQMVAAATCASSCAYGLPATAINDVYTIAGTGTIGTAGNAGPATSAGLNDPYGVTVDSSGNVLIADTGNNRIQMLANSTCSPAASCAYGVATTANDVYTIAGSASGTSGSTGDTGLATSAQLSGPQGLAVDVAGNLFIADTVNNKIRMVAVAACSSGCAYGVNTTANDIYTVIGTGSAACSSDGTAATSSAITSPQGLAVDTAGNLLIAATGNNRISMVPKITGTYYGVSATANDIYTVAGSATCASGAGGDAGAATSAWLSGPQGLAVDGSGNLLIAATGNNSIRMVANSTATYYGVGATANDIYTVAGTGIRGDSGDGGLSTSAGLYGPTAVVVSASGNLFLSQDSVALKPTPANRIREVVTNAPAVTAVSPASGSTSGGTSVTITGVGFTGATAVMFGGTAATWFAVTSDTSITATTPAESAATVDVTVTAANGTSATISGDQYTFAAPPTVTGVSPSSGGGFASVTITGTAFTGASAVMFGATNATSYLVSSATSITAVAPVESAGTVDITVTNNGMTSTTSGSDQFTYTGAPPITTIAGGAIGDGTSNYTSELNTPIGVAVDGSGNVFIADESNRRVRMLAAATCSSNCAFGIATTKNYIYTIAGNGTQGYNGDGILATSAQLSGPFGVALDSAGDLIFADNMTALFGSGANSRIRLVARTTSSSYGLGTTVVGDIYTLAGNGTKGYTNDGHAATTAEINQPSGIAVDSSGNIIFADTGNNVVRMVAATTGTNYGISTTANYMYTVAGYAGNNGASGNPNVTGISSTDPTVKFNNPAGIAIGGCTNYLLYNCSGSIFIADSSNNVIRMVVKTAGNYYGQSSLVAGDIYTVAGNGTDSSLDEVAGTPTTAEFGNPKGVLIDNTGDILVSEQDYSVSLYEDVRLVANSTATLYGLARTANNTYTLVGTGGGEASTGDGAQAVNARVDTPTGLALNSEGDLLIADSSWAGNADRVRLLSENTCVPVCQPVYGLSSTTARRIYTIAGNGTEANSGATAPLGTAVALSGVDMGPQGGSQTAVDASGNVLFTDRAANLVRMVAGATGTYYGISTTKGHIYNIAGDGSANTGTYTSNRVATSAEVTQPTGITIDSSGNVLITDQGDNLVLMVSEVVNCSTPPCAYGLAATVKGDIYIVAGGSGTGSTANGNSGDGGLATSAKLNSPSSVAVDSTGNLIIADSGNNRIRMAAAATCSPAPSCAYGVPTTAHDIYDIAGGNGTGAGGAGNTGDGGFGYSAKLANPISVAVDGSGDLLISDQLNSRVRMVAAATCISTCAYGMATTVHDIYNFAGQASGTGGYAGDGGLATAATMSFNTNQLTVDASGNVLIADTGNNVVRMVTNTAGTYYGTVAAQGDIYTIAGNGTGGVSLPLGDGGPATSAMLMSPTGIAKDSSGNLYIATGPGSGLQFNAIREVFTNAPSVTSISPTSGPSSGSTSVTITGTGLGSATAVNFGGTTGTINSNTATQIVATSPAESAGPVDITVTTANGTSAINAGDQFTFVAQPTVTAVSPSSGPTGGGSRVTITGTSFIGVSGAAAVKFGANNAAAYTVNSPTQITATSPAGGAGTVDITVVSTGGTSATGAPDHFTYSGTSGVLTSMSWATSNNQNSATSVQYAWSFTTATNGTISKVTFSVPAATAGTATNVAVYGLGAGTWSGPTAGLITYTVTSPAAVSGGTPIYLSANGITNTSAAGGFSSQISTYISGPTLLDQGTANSITFGASNTATPMDMPETMTYTNDTSAFTLMPIPGGGAVSQVINVTVNTNAATGYTLAIQATPLTNGTTTLSQMTTSGAGSLAVDQFAARATAAGCATLASPYTSSKYVGYNTSTNASVASCATPTSGTDTVAMTNWIQVDSSAPAGTYTSTITYVVTPNY
jgi:secreted PhoX family phosphatase